MTRFASDFRIVAGFGLLISSFMAPWLATAQRPVISSCVASPSVVAPGGTTTIHVKAASPSGLPLHFIYTATTGTVQGDGASATFTTDASATGVVTILCEARDSHDSWVRSRTWVKVVGTASAAAATPKLTPAKPESAAGGVPASGAKIAQAPHSVPPPTVTHPTPPPAVIAPAPAHPTQVPSRSAPPVPQPAQARASTTPPVAMPTPSLQHAAPAATPPQAMPAPTQAAPVTPQTVPTASPAVVSTVPAQGSEETARLSPNNSGANEGAKQSQNGLIEYTVPQKMVVGVASKVTVKIHGYSVAANTTKTGSLTAQYMKVLLFAEDSGELKIVSLGKADIQYVPKNKTATWVWSVTPMGAANQKLQVRVFEEFKTDAEQDVDEESYTVNVTAPSRFMLAKEAYFGDPDAWWKYWLPSGAVCFLLIWIFLRLIDPRKKMSGGTAQNFEANDWL